MAPSSGSVFSETLHTITTTKLEELAKQRQSFEHDYAQLLDASKAEKDSLKRVCLLQDGVKSCLGVGGGAGSHDDQVANGGARNVRLETDLKNLDRFLEQARFDPSVSQKVLGDWEATLLRYLEVQSARFQYADLYGKLVTEWLSPDKSKSTDNDVEMAESFEELPGAKKLAARTEWEKSVFEPAEIDVDALELYLNHLFDMGDKAGETAIRTLIRDKVTAFENGLANRPLTHNNLVQTINSLQKSDLLSDDKREALKDFLGNSVILAEINDILNVRMSALDRWNWGDHVSVEQRRMLNGGFSIQFDPDLLQAIFLHYIGNMWSVFFKKTFQALLEHAIWKKSHAEISKTDRMRRTYFLGHRGLAKNNSLQNKRIRVHRNRYFAHQLLDYASQAIEMQDGEEEADFSEYAQQTMQMPMAAMAHPAPPAKRVGRTKQTARKSTGGKAPRMQLASASSDLDFGFQLVDEEGYFEKEEEEDDDSGESDEEVNDDDYRGGSKKPMESKQKLLHVVSTEIIVNTRLHGELTCFRTVFDSWNPLLPHDTITTVLKFFGVSAKWMKFFVKFLQAPLKFMEDENSEPRVRRRGAPGAHTLSDVFSEVIFFCLDFSINKGTEGAVVHRLYDDIWFWNKDYETCARAWSKVQEFSNVTNMSLDEKKTGSVRVTTDGGLTVDDRLPKGQIRWGFLVLDSKTGRFEIDKNMVNGHVEELRGQLDGKSKSVIDWIQAWNSYAATFFSSNFGQAANCFGREHVDDMLATHRHIQESIFQGGNVVSYLKSLIEDRFGVKNIPDGFLFFPVELGGLDLKSPFVDLLQIRESVVEEPQKLLTDFLELEEEDYDKAKRKFDNGVIRHPNVSWKQVGKANEDADEFFPFAEFTKYREDFARYDRANLRQTYSLLLLRPQMQPIQVTKHISQYLDELGGKHNLRSITSNWHHMESYWKWVTQMYGPEMTERFGGLNVVDFGLLPIGMVSMFRERRTKWQG